MGEIGKIGQHHHRIGAGFVLVLELAERGGHIAFDDMLEEIDDPGAIGKAEHARPL